MTKKNEREMEQQKNREKGIKERKEKKEKISNKKR